MKYWDRMKRWSHKKFYKNFIWYSYLFIICKTLISFLIILFFLAILCFPFFGQQITISQSTKKFNRNKGLLELQIKKTKINHKFRNAYSWRFLLKPNQSLKCFCSFEKNQTYVTFFDTAKVNSCLKNIEWICYEKKTF